MKTFRRQVLGHKHDQVIEETQLNTWNRRNRFRLPRTKVFGLQSSQISKIAIMCWKVSLWCSYLLVHIFWPRKSESTRYFVLEMVLDRQMAYWKVCSWGLPGKSSIFSIPLTAEKTRFQNALNPNAHDLGAWNSLCALPHHPWLLTYQQTREYMGYIFLDNNGHSLSENVPIFFIWSES